MHTVNREEAVLRELNLYPQWKLREGGGEATGYPAASPSRGLREGGGADNSTGDSIPGGLRAVGESAGMTERSVSLQAETANVPLGAPEAHDSQSRALASRSQPSSPGLVEAAPVVEPLAAPALAEPASPAPPQGSREQVIGELGWPELKTMVRDCTACKLRAGCTQTVFGVGDEQARWLFVGEGPGADEDVQGEPFVGQAGKLLDNMLLSIKLKRGQDVYIGNVVKCRPPGNRTPEADEIATCMPYLRRQIALIRPKIIVALGKTAANALLGKDATLASLRGRVHDFDGIPLVITYHPAYLLRTPADKAKAWQDLCLATKNYGRLKHGEE